IAHEATGIDPRMEAPVRLEVDRGGGRFRVATTSGEFEADAVVLATGGRSLPKTGSDGFGLEIARRLGHSIVPTTPALAPLILSDTDNRCELSGVAQNVELAIWIDDAIDRRLRGALLWTHFGVSGPVALNASRHLLRAWIEGRKAGVTINLRPGVTFDAVDADLTARAAQDPRTTLQNGLSSLMPASVAAALLQRLGIDAGTALAHLSREDRRRVARAIVESPLSI